MKRKIMNSIFLSLLIILSLSLFTNGDEKNIISVGKVYIPIDVKYGTETIVKGNYDLKLVFEDSNPYIEIYKGDNKLVKELAITIEAKRTSKKPKIEVAKITNQEFLRLRILFQNKWYYAYFEELK